MLIDLALHPAVFEKVRKEVSQHILNDDMAAIQHSPILNACLMETARLNPTIFGVTRKCTEDMIIGNYCFKKGDILAISTPTIMRDEAIFREPNVYNPNRFLGKQPESWGNHKVINWGAGIHLCPGKQFAINEIKVSMAYLVHNFRFEVPSKKVFVKFATTTSFAERKVDILLRPI
jgi:cytochrome P450